ncbi:MAG: hypothetical protein JRI97_06900 [Deltaproteobacteria bacterium]|nr:hypothetical protein [Deltaproteobacteria bacterium]
MTTSRKLPDTYNVSTYGDGAEYDYTSLAAWEADTDTDLVAAGAGEVLDVAEGGYDDSAVVAGAVTSSTLFRVIRAAAGAENRCRKDAGARFVSAVRNLLIQWDEAYGGVYDLGLCLGARNDSSWRFLLRLNAAYARAAGCFAYDSVNNGTGQMLGIYPRNTAGISCVANCLAHNVDRGFYVDDVGAGNTAYMYNCTAAGCTYGVHAYRGTVEAKNCAVEGNDTNYYAAAGAAINKTACTDGDGVVFEDQQSGDLHLAEADAAARNQGADLSADPVFAFDDDIDGDTRNPAGWDVGADEFLFRESLADGVFAVDAAHPSVQAPPLKMSFSAAVPSAAFSALAPSVAFSCRE